MIGVLSGNDSEGIAEAMELLPGALVANNVLETISGRPALRPAARSFLRPNGIMSRADAHSPQLAPMHALAKHQGKMNAAVRWCSGDSSAGSFSNSP